eukprot:CAMPEP_0177398878 /NCGR_PEP_ID=MMETSP0368-20130122/58156_1 /TAXON_ID=447022 ORGANISM="Scrippsiella hangoei-like, Strain SHHI-4" /NCGR_SAMPLE_ID=MMETSP0368 /ASSEMBLY_ACC=CAM_ASM_000363 /LENGTH=48 /DNA_ID= /DNA_START= /DNA_END= /DNA_ORIENTATION=
MRPMFVGPSFRASAAAGAQLVGSSMYSATTLLVKQYDDMLVESLDERH